MYINKVFHVHCLEECNYVGGTYALLTTSYQLQISLWHLKVVVPHLTPPSTTTNNRSTAFSGLIINLLKVINCSNCIKT